jgi:hypothetical protein
MLGRGAWIAGIRAGGATHAALHQGEAKQRHSDQQATDT